MQANNPVSHYLIQKLKKKLINLIFLQYEVLLASQNFSLFVNTVAGFSYRLGEVQIWAVSTCAEYALTWVADTSKVLLLIFILVSFKESGALRLQSDPQSGTVNAFPNLFIFPFLLLLYPLLQLKYCNNTERLFFVDNQIHHLSIGRAPILEG